MVTIGSYVFDGFGQCRFVRDDRPAEQLKVGAKRRTTRTRIRRECPRLPGVYGMIDATGELIYVGQSRRLRDRLLSYFARSAVDKARRIAGQAVSLVWETTGHELTAQLRELMLIRRWRPRFNRRGLSGPRAAVYVCLGRRPAAYAYLAARPGKTADNVFGPIVGFRRGRRALAAINDLLRLRDCPQSVTMTFSDQADLFVEPRVPCCLRFELQTCLGPCIGACSNVQYTQQVRQAEALFAGTDRAPLDRLANEMATAAHCRRYERAAALRDKLADIEWLLTQLADVRQARRDYSFIYPVTSHCSQATWYLIRGADVRHVVPAPRGSQTARRCLQLLSATYDRPPAAGDAPEDIDVEQLVAGWFRRRPHELTRVLSPAEAASRCERYL